MRNPNPSPLLRSMLQRVALMAADAEAPKLSQAAGIRFIDPAGRSLFVKRGRGGDHPGKWCFPGGGLEEGETAEDAAIRECGEEIGAMPYGERRKVGELAHDGVHYTTFEQPVTHAFKPRLNDENEAHIWAERGREPEPLHPGVRKLLSPHLAGDAGFVEADHPRADNGQFGNGSGGHPAPPPAQPVAAVHAQAEGARAHMPAALYGEAKRTVALHKREEKTDPLTPEQAATASKQLEPYLAAAHAAKEDYDRRLTSIAHELGAKVLLASMSEEGGLAEDAAGEKWITVHPNANGPGSPVLIGEGGEVKAGMGGKFNGEKITEVRSSFEGPRSGAHRAREASKPAGPTPPAAEPVRGENWPFGAKNPPASPGLEDHQRNAIAKSDALREKYGQKGDGSRAQWEEAARTGEMDHLWPEHEQNLKAAAAAALKPGHIGMAEPRKVLKETDKGLGIENKLFTRAQEKKGRGELLTPAESSALMNRESLRWIPKAGASIKDGHVIGVEPWVAEKHGFKVNGELPAKEKEERQYLRVPFEQKDEAKRNGARWDAEKRSWYYPKGGDLPAGLGRFKPQLAAPAPVAPSGAMPATPFLHQRMSETTPRQPSELAPKRDYRDRLPKYGRVDESDPSIYGSWLLGHEGEPWAVVRNYAPAPKGSEPQQTAGERERHWAYSTEAVQRALHGQDEAPENYDVDAEDEDADDMLPDDEPRMAADKAMFVRRAAADGLAFDRGTVRRIDQDGRMHVEIANISKATVNPYLGHEIPGWEELGLEPDKVYQLFRDPAELAAGAATFNSIPLLNRHIPVSAENHQPKSVVGATGSEASFEAPYLRNSLVIWAADAIEGIESGEQRELSCAYRYIPVMEPGTYEGTRYDGRMTQIVGNHVALVPSGRCGADVIVGDSSGPDAIVRESTSDEGNAPMKHGKLSRHALLAKGALLGLISPKLAADSKINLDSILAGVNAANWLKRKAGIVHAIRAKLAADADLSEVVDLLDKLNPGAGTAPAKDDEADGDPGAGPNDGEEVKDALDADPAEEILAMLRGKLSDEDLEAVAAKIKALTEPAAADAPPPEPGVMPPPKDGEGEGGKPEDDTGEAGEKFKPAMDAKSVKALVDRAKDDVRRQSREAAQARETVRPWVGNVSVALDSAEAVFRAALDMLGVKTEGVHPTAFEAILKVQPRPGEARHRPIAADSASASDFAARFPGLSDIKNV